MDLDRLEAFRSVARVGSIAAAARAAGSDPSAVSRSIAALEAELGFRLFQRSTRRLALTEAGERYLRRIDPLIDEFTAAREEALGLVGRPRGHLRVTASSAFGQTVIAPLLASFRRAFPDVVLELLLTDAIVDLVTERVDLAFRLGPRPSGDYIVGRLRPTKMQVVASPSYLREALAVKEPTDLATSNCLLSALQRSARWTFRRRDETEEVVVTGGVATSNTVVLRHCALDGLGLALLADWLVDRDVAEGRLAVVLPDWTVSVGDTEPGVWIVYPSRSFLPLKTRAFINLLRGHAFPAVDLKTARSLRLS